MPLWVRQEIQEMPWGWRLGAQRGPRPDWRHFQTKSSPSKAQNFWEPRVNQSAPAQFLFSVALTGTGGPDCQALGSFASPWVRRVVAGKGRACGPSQRRHRWRWRWLSGCQASCHPRPRRSGGSSHRCWSCLLQRRSDRCRDQERAQGCSLIRHPDRVADGLPLGDRGQGRDMGPACRATGSAGHRTCERGQGRGWSRQRSQASGAWRRRKRW